MNPDSSNLFPAQDFDNKKITHYSQNINVNVHHFYLYGVIEDDIHIYADLLNILRTSNENDTIIIYINSEGGVLRMALQIANAMLTTPARVITSLDGEASSAATLIFLAGEEYIINPNCSFMIHNYSAGVWGKGHELQAHIDHRRLTVTKIMEDFYCKILTEEELEDVIKGRDIWMDSDELTKRLEAIEPEKVSTDVDSAEFTKDAIKENLTIKTKKKTKKKVSKNEN